MKIKNWFGNQYRSPFVVKLIRKTKMTMAVIAVMCLMGWTSYFTTKVTKPVTVFAEKQVKVEVPVNADMPVLERIAQCESNGKQFGSNGQVLLKANDNHTVDIGYMQINQTIWGKKASSMGYDLTKEIDNKAFGQWLFLNYGSEPWYLSKKCWNK